MANEEILNLPEMLSFVPEKGSIYLGKQRVFLTGVKAFGSLRKDLIYGVLEENNLT